MRTIYTTESIKKLLPPKYHALIEIGEGGESKVFKVFDSERGHDVALKILKTDSGLSSEIAKREFRILSQLVHRNIVKVFDYGILESGIPYFTQELIHGRSITEFFHHSYKEKIFSEIIDQIFDGLDYLHRSDIIHGDVKPENIFITSDQTHSEVRLIDFGMSNLHSDKSSLSGTIEYISPEQIRGQTATPKSDLYSLGIILFEIVYGSVPFRGETIQEVLRKHLLEPLPLLLPLHEISPGIITLIKNLLVKDPSIRPGSITILKRLLSEEGTIQIDSTQQPSIQIPPAFSGRESELKIFDQGIDDGQNGTVFIISGEDGIGKTRFIQECRLRIQLKGFDAITIQAASLQKKNIIDLIQTFIHQATSLGRIQSHVAEEIFQHYAEYEKVSMQAGEENKPALQRFIDHSIDVLVSTRLSKGCAYIIDDADQLDEQCIHFLESLIRVSKVRTSEKTYFTFSVSNTISFADDDAHIVHIALKPFDDQSLDAVITSIFGPHISIALNDKLRIVSSGKPFDLIEYAQYLYNKNYLEFTDSEWKIRSEIQIESDVPKSLEQIAQKQIQNLTNDEREILHLLSLTNIPLSTDHLVNCMIQSNEERVLEHIDSLMKDRLVMLSGNGFQIKSNSVKDVVRNQIDRQKKIEYHEFLGNSLFNSINASQLEESGLQFEHCSELQKAAEALINSGEKYLFSFQLKKSEQVVKRVLQIENANLHPDQQLQAYSLLARAYKLSGRYELYGETMDELHHLLRAENDEVGLIDVFLQEAEIFSTLGNLDRASRTAIKALDLSKKHQLHIKTAAAHVQLGVAEYHQGKYRDAIQEYEKGINLFLDHHAERDAAGTLLNAGFAATFTLSPKDGITYFEKANSIFTKLEDEYGRARALGNLGVAFYLLGQYQRSLDVRLEANQIFSSLYDKRGQANAEASIGKVLETMGKFGESEIHLTQALQLMREIGDQLGEARCHETIGLLAIDTGRYEMAFASFRKAQDIARRLDNNDMLVLSYQNYALTYFFQNDQDSCERELLRAMQLRNEVSDCDVLHNLDIARLMFFIKRNTIDDRENAKKISEELLHQIQNESSDSHKRWLLIKKAELLLNTNDQYAAYASSSAAIDDLTEIKYDEWAEQEIYYIHAQVCKSVGKIGESNEYLRHAYDEIQRKAESCTDPEVRKSFLESVSINRSIVAEYAKVLEQPKAATEQLIMNDRNLNALYKVSATINSILELDVLLPRILDLSIETMQGERGMIFLYEDGKLVLQVARNVDRETIADATEISESVIHDVVQYGKPLIVNDAQQNNAFRSRQSVRNFQITSIVCVPIRLKDKIIGTVYIDRRASFQTSLSELHLDLQFLEAFANLAAIAIENARLHKKLQEENQYLRQQVGEQFGFANIIGTSPSMQAMYRLMKGAMQSDSPVFIHGESGTGKELVARAIHFHGIRKGKKFIAIDCGALPETLLESELFGHVKGSFTGALTDKKGLFEEADGGSVFLDEITNTSASFQSKLLRVLQEGEIRRIGENEVRHVNLRVIAATNLEIENEIASGRFRQDLFYRLNVIPISAPSLRDRAEDIPALVQHFISKYKSISGNRVRGVSQDLMQELTLADWKGNVRELENIINRLIIFSESDILTKKSFQKNVSLHIPQSQSQKPSHLQIKTTTLASEQKSLHDIERNHILRVLQEASGNKTEAARRLDLKRTTLLKKMKKLGIM